MVLDTYKATGIGPVGSHYQTFIKRYLRSMLLLAGIGCVAAYSYFNLNYNWQWYRIPDYLFMIRDGKFHAGLLMQGLAVTLQISVISLFMAMAVGFSTAMMRLSTSPVLNGAALVYVEVVRNTPLLIQLFVIYFVISPVIDLSPFASAVAALSLFEGAYASEIIRTGILQVPREQWEASYSLGLSVRDTYREVVFPQALRQMLPMLASQSISLVKDSALVSTISIFELTMRAQTIISETFLTFEIWFTVAVCYFLLSIALSLLIGILERKRGAGASPL